MPDQTAERREQRLANQLALEATPGPWREDDVATDDGALETPRKPFTRSFTFGRTD